MFFSLSSEYKSFVTFFGVSLLFIAGQWILFNGFNGSDDLHYAMLAAKMLKGEYNPFERNDIFSGRILLISIQALIYKTFGTSVLTTSAGTVIATIAACYLTIFNFLQKKKPFAVFILSCLFYFSPVLINSIKGIMPDAYVMLTGVFILLILKRSLSTEISAAHRKALHLLIGFIIAISLLLKETGIVFIPFTIIFYLINNKKECLLNSLIIFISFATMIFIFGVIYYRFTGDPFFKIDQIKNSEMENSCNFSNQPFSALLKRLTFGAWQRFIISGYYTVIIGVIASATILFEKKKPNSASLNNVWYFIAMLIIGLYFPFSLKGYQPLCDHPRHFLFLIPFAVISFSTFLDNEQFSKKAKLFFSVSLLFVFLFCTGSTLNKWQWMIWGCFLLFSFAFFLKLSVRMIFILLPVILFTGIFERMFFLHNTWFYQTKKINSVVKSSHYYFINQDNMMHWKLLHNFDEENIHYFNLQNNVFKIFLLYNDTPDKKSFHPGWLILNKSLKTTPIELIRNINSSERCQFYSQKIGGKDIYALLISKPEQLQLIQFLMK
jgi:hypothetical protein